MNVTTSPDMVGMTFQDLFPLQVDCCHCQKKAELIFVAHECNEPIEQEGGVYLLQIHAGDSSSEGLWFHDAIAVANYMCRNCFKITAIFNQA